VSLKTLVPWRAKLLAKLALSHLPFGYGIWRRLSLFRHGAMDRPGYALEVFLRHFQRFRAIHGDEPFAALEIGPGDSAFSALIAYAHGASRCYLVDVAPFASRELDAYRTMADQLSSTGLRVPPASAFGSFEALLDACGASYETRGLESLHETADDSVDFAWSHAVLEHVRRAEMAPMLRELRRIQRPNGLSSHMVDLRDHFNWALNNLRFGDSFWESDLVAGSGFYTNRLRFSELLGLFEEAGFAPEVVSATRWDELPTPRRKLAERFANLSDEELLVAGFDVVLR
jgi:SAM-dependent methyltransferase